MDALDLTNPVSVNVAVRHELAKREEQYVWLPPDLHLRTRSSYTHMVFIV